MKIILLKNAIIGSRRYVAGEDADVDAALGKSLVDAALAAESPTVKAAEEKPSAKRPARRSSVKAVKA
jgi:hypothetical protein